MENSDSDNTSRRMDTKLWMKLGQAEIVIALGVSSPYELEYIQQVFEARRSTSTSLAIQQRHRLCHFALDCIDNNNNINNNDSISGNAIQLSSLVGPYDPQRPTFASNFLRGTFVEIE